MLKNMKVNGESYPMYYGKQKSKPPSSNGVNRIRAPYPMVKKTSFFPYGYGSIPINTIFRGMNIHKSQLF